ncbi:PREDICTED: uncharacterized protein LOC109480458 [Branchiostoma belcheri]|uniref:Uncharacterized protein LOC109480458 n=1 Tax=Branchiostoma belcheri TaxID=7741 RepID=A0A6P5A4T1_BRABE|nr:PREDICTED: uncharacterized protein LOC109480458 [Branchiostoma belcheri]
MSASTSSSELSDRTHGFDKNATTEDVLAWILEYACKYGQNEVVKALSAGDPKQLLQYGILEGRLAGYLLWSCVTENVVEGYDLCVQLLRHTYTHAPLVNFSHYARILYGLKVKVMLHILADRFELCLASSKLKELFPKEGEKLPPLLKHDATLERQLNQLNRRSGQFRQLALDLILDREKREGYLRHEVEEEFGAEFSLALHDLVAKFVQTVEDYLPAPVIQEICSSELYLTPPDGCSHAVSSLLTVLEATNGNPSAANLTQLVHELHNVSTTKTDKRNCSPGRNEVKLHSSFKSPKTKDRKAEIRGNCSMKLQFKGRGSATQGSTSTESSDSVCSGVTPIPQSDSSNEELSQVSSELHSDCSTGGKKETKTRKQNCSPGRKEVKLSKPHSSFKSPERKDKTVKSHRNSSVRPKSKEKGSSTGSTSTESSDSQRTVCSGVSILSDSSNEELVQVSNEFRSDCSTGVQQT